jgi:hypothetical protein
MLRDISRHDMTPNVEWSRSAALPSSGFLAVLFLRTRALSLVQVLAQSYACPRVPPPHRVLPLPPQSCRQE